MVSFRVRGEAKSGAVYSGEGRVRGDTSGPRDHNEGFQAVGEARRRRRELRGLSDCDAGGSAGPGGCPPRLTARVRQHIE